MAIQPSRRMAMWSAALLLLSVVWPVAAEEPTLARLSFWVPPERMAEFEVIYEEQVTSKLVQFGLVESAEHGRATVDSVFSRLFVVGSPELFYKTKRRLQEDAVWTEVLLYLGRTFYRDEKETALRHRFALYAGPVRPDTVVTAGLGTRRGSWLTFDISDGLVPGNVRDLLQDRQGDLWFVIGGKGAVRFDGTRFVTYTTDSVLAPHGLTDILQDQDGSFWFATGQGVVQFDGARFFSFSREDGLADGDVSTMLQDREGSLWFATWGRGISRYDGESWESFDAANSGLAGNGVSAMLQDREGILWFATWNGHTGLGVSRYDRESWKTFDTASSGLAGTDVEAMLQDREGALWFAVWGKGVCRYDGEHWETFDTASSGLASNLVTSIIEDRQGNLWFGTLGSGVSRYDGKNWETFGSEDGLANDQVSAILEDRQGSLWFGVQSGGISRYDEAHMATFTTRDGLVHNLVLAAAEDRDGNMWFGTVEGISRFDGKEWMTFDTANGLTSNHITAALGDRNGNLWFGTFDGGICQFDGQQWTTFDATNTDGLKSNSIFFHSVFEDRDGNLWFGTYGGASRFDGQEWKTISTADGLPGNQVRAVLQDREGRMWFGTRKGASCFNGREWSHFAFDGREWGSYTAADTLRSVIWVDSILERAGDDNLWFGTTDGSISRYDGKEWEIFTTTDGLPESRALSMTEDRSGQLWIGTHGGGIVRFDDTLFQTLQKADRLAHNAVQQIVQDHSGDIWIATEGGVTRYRPHSQSPESPIISATTDRDHGWVDTLGVPLSQKYLRFNIAGRCIPANRVGGDFFQYFEQEGKLSICMADVTGHGMEAAIPVVMFNGILESQMELGGNLVNLFSRLNRSMHRTRVDNRTFACFTMGEIDLFTHNLQLANGGCPYPLHYHAVTGAVTELQIDTYPLGARANTVYSIIQVQLELGDRLVFCSDGIAEATNVEEEIFGFERTAKTIRQGCSEGLSAEALIDLLIGEVKEFAGDAQQEDDMTVVVLRVEG